MVMLCLVRLVYLLVVALLLLLSCAFLGMRDPGARPEQCLGDETGFARPPDADDGDQDIRTRGCCFGSMPT
ncbi:hypothetical protein B0T24DRAFT_644639 [Lasiosphaeria ovina]|uniref:Secreted protein n=1 Tax=Lasiosphaeria ovina TaxID=92902 RepID=A0AAE0JS07_9PEZI|nr:hypothetical protein B0T24DRAFT_644639 [Lasiosphaeria ovina]